MHEKAIATNPISDFSNVSKSKDDSSIDCAAMTPMRSCTIEYQAGHRPLCMWILNTIVKGVLESYMYSFRVFFLESKEFSACSHSILQRACTRTWRHHWMIMTMSQVLSVLSVLGFRSLILGCSRQETMGIRRGKSRGSLQNGHLTTRRNRRHPVNPSVLLLRGICSYGIYVV